MQDEIFYFILRSLIEDVSKIVKEEYIPELTDRMKFWNCLNKYEELFPVIAEEDEDEDEEL